MRFVFLQNKIELIASIEFGKRTHRKMQFDYVQLPNQSKSNRTDWFRLSRLIFGSVSFDKLPRVNSTRLIRTPVSAA